MTHLIYIINKLLIKEYIFLIYKIIKNIMKVKRSYYVEYFRAIILYIGRYRMYIHLILLFLYNSQIILVLNLY